MDRLSSRALRLMALLPLAAPICLYHCRLVLTQVEELIGPREIG